MLALLDHIGKHADSMAVASLICNRPDAAGINFAEQRGFSVSVVDHKSFPDRTSFETQIDQHLRANATDLICLAGFMRILSPPFVEKWHGRMLNIHPSLLPAYKGLNTHQRALDDGATEHGCTVHYVVPEMDAGPIIRQTSVAVFADDTEQTLAARVLNVEHETYCNALDDVIRTLRKAAGNKKG